MLFKIYFELFRPVTVWQKCGNIFFKLFQIVTKYCSNKQRFATKLHGFANTISKTPQ